MAADIETLARVEHLLREGVGQAIAAGRTIARWTWGIDFNREGPLAYRSDSTACCLLAPIAVGGLGFAKTTNARLGISDVERMSILRGFDEKVFDQKDCDRAFFDLGARLGREFVDGVKS